MDKCFCVRLESLVYQSPNTNTDADSSAFRTLSTVFGLTEEILVVMY